MRLIVACLILLGPLLAAGSQGAGRHYSPPKLAPPPTVLRTEEILAATIETTDAMHAAQARTAMTIESTVVAQIERCRAVRLTTVAERDRPSGPGPGNGPFFVTETERKAAIEMAERRLAEARTELARLESGDVAIPATRAGAIGPRVRTVAAAPGCYLEVKAVLDDGRVVVERRRKKDADAAPQPTDRLEDLWLVEHPPESLRRKGLVFETFEGPIILFPAAPPFRPEHVHSLTRIAFIAPALETDGYRAAAKARGAKLVDTRHRPPA